MNTLLKAVKKHDNVSTTENGGITYRSSLNGLIDLFALGGAYRDRSDEDCITLFDAAFQEDPAHALKCLFYLRDAREGQGCRRFFRIVIKYLAKKYPKLVIQNIENIPFYGRWDDLYALVDTPVEDSMFRLIADQMKLDLASKTPSLLAKWLKSENTSSAESRQLATRTRKALQLSSKEYRLNLSKLRERINIVERLMSAGKWDEIDFSALPSRAGIIYRNAFARHDVERMKSQKENVVSYADFAKDTTTKVNAGTLYPCDIVHKAEPIYVQDLNSTERLMINKYWDNLSDYFHNAVFNGIAVVDTSGSMTLGPGTIHPIDVAIALGMYCASKCNPASPWYNHYISFSRRPNLIEIKGADFVDKVHRIYKQNLCENTDIQAVFDLLLDLALDNHIPQEDLPKNVIIISDMEFDQAQGYYSFGREKAQSVMETVMTRWRAMGYETPHLVFWNVNARNDNIPMEDNGNVTFVSGYSPVLFEQLLSGKTGLDFILEKLDSERYNRVVVG